jgi:2-C-methyl-D-erythritol 4-phosphate cytidylyltransferase
MPGAWAVVVAGGAGARFGAPKQFSLLAGQPVVARAIEACRPHVEGVVLVVPAGYDQEGFGADHVVTGGSSRSASVRAGLAALPGDTGVVIVHDAARPLAQANLFAAVLASLDDPSVGAAICAVPVTDTLKRVAPPLAESAAAVVLETLDRSTLVSVQTPQAFRSSILREAHAQGNDATDDAALVEALGATVRVVLGDPRNIKITTPSDLALAEQLLAR